MALDPYLLTFNPARPAVDNRGVFTKEVADALTRLFRAYNATVTEVNAMNDAADAAAFLAAARSSIPHECEFDSAPLIGQVAALMSRLYALETSPASSGSAAWTEYEIDFGSTPVYDATFTVIDAGVSVSTEVAVVQSGNAATGRAAGDALWDSISYAALPGAGQFTLYALATPGPVVGRRKVLYQVGT